jgi:cytochrome c-type biogenesis protein CcmH/NrfG
MTDASPWRATRVYLMAGICLVLGFAVGYLFRGSASASPSQPRAVKTMPQSAIATPMPSNEAAETRQMPTLELMKTMGDTKAKPLLDQLKNDPNNAALLNQIGKIYESTHQFKTAEQYFDRSLRVASKNIAIRTEMASCLYYDGNVDGALDQLQQSLKSDPNDMNSLFNLGLIRWQGKNDAAGALAAWEKLRKQNLPSEKRLIVERSIARLKQQIAAN